MILRLDETMDFGGVKKYLKTNGLTFENDIISFSSDDAILDIDRNTEELIGYVSDDRANTYVKISANGKAEFIGHIDDSMTELFKIEPLLFGYPIYRSLNGKNKSIYTYRVEVKDKNIDFYTLSNSELDLSNILI